MLRHCVMFRWNEGVTAEVTDRVKSGLDALAALDGVAAYRHGPDAGLSDGNWDYVVVGDFIDEAAYRAYGADADHVALINEWIKPNISARAAVQYTLD